MTKTTLFFASIALTIPSLHAAQPAPIIDAPETAASALTVRIYNYAGVEAALVREAAALAHETYQRSGIETRWSLCEVPGVEIEGAEQCGGFQSPDTIMMRIVAEAPANQEGVHHVVFGFALPKKDGFGSLASVFWARIAETAEKTKVTPAQLLSVVMAHEAGHLLLGFNSHAGNGLMSGRWDDERFTKISQGALSFIGKQKKRVQTGAEARLRAAAGR